MKREQLRIKPPVTARSKRPSVDRTGALSREAMAWAAGVSDLEEKRMNRQP
jgi:hypothetical protein